MIISDTDKFQEEKFEYPPPPKLENVVVEEEVDVWIDNIIYNEIIILLRNTIKYYFNHYFNSFTYL